MPVLQTGLRRLTGELQGCSSLPRDDLDIRFFQETITRTATRIAFLLPLAAIALTSAGCDTGKASRPTADPPAKEVPVVEDSGSPTPTTTPGTTPTTPPAAAPAPDADRAAPATETGVNLRAIDWANARLSLPASTRCPSPVQFKNHEAKIKDYLYWIVDGPRRPAYGDLDGDGREEAVVPITCGNGGDGTEHLVVFAAGGNRARPITSIRTQHLVSFTTHSIKNGQLIATLRQSEIVSSHPETQVRKYRLRSGSLVQISGPTRFNNW